MWLRLLISCIFALWHCVALKILLFTVFFFCRNEENHHPSSHVNYVTRQNIRIFIICSKLWNFLARISKFLIFIAFYEVEFNRIVQSQTCPFEEINALSCRYWWSFCPKLQTVYQIHSCIDFILPLFTYNIIKWLFD